MRICESPEEDVCLLAKRTQKKRKKGLRQMPLDALLDLLVLREAQLADLEDDLKRKEGVANENLHARR